MVVMDKLTRCFAFKELNDSDAKTNEMFLFGGYDFEQVYKQVEEQQDDNETDPVLRIQRVKRFRPERVHKYDLRSRKSSV